MTTVFTVFPSFHKNFHRMISFTLLLYSLSLLASTQVYAFPISPPRPTQTTPELDNGPVQTQFIPTPAYYITFTTPTPAPDSQGTGVQRRSDQPTTVSVTTLVTRTLYNPLSRRDRHPMYDPDCGTPKFTDDPDGKRWYCPNRKTTTTTPCTSTDVPLPTGVGVEIDIDYTEGRHDISQRQPYYDDGSNGGSSMVNGNNRNNFYSDDYQAPSQNGGSWSTPSDSGSGSGTNLIPDSDPNQSNTTPQSDPSNHQNNGWCTFSSEDKKQNRHDDCKLPPMQQRGNIGTLHMCAGSKFKHPENCRKKTFRVGECGMFSKPAAWLIFGAHILIVYAVELHSSDIHDNISSVEAQAGYTCSIFQ